MCIRDSAVTAVLNTAANRKFSFGVHGREDALKHQLFGFGVFLFGWAVTAGALRDCMPSHRKRRSTSNSSC